MVNARTESQPPPPGLTLRGLVGDSDREGFRRIYLSRDLSHYAELRSSDVLDVQVIPAEEQPSVGEGASQISIRRDAPLEFTHARPALPVDEFDLDIQMAGSGGVNPMLPPATNISCFGCGGGGDPKDPNTGHCPPESAFCGGDSDDCGGASEDDTCGRTCEGCPTDVGNTCNSCHNTCDQATCQTCDTNCDQGTCGPTCGQATCRTCDTCAGQATCKRTCDCDTMNPHACGGRD